MKENITQNKSHSKLDLESLLVNNNEIPYQVRDDIRGAKAFTLIELLVVVLIITILAAVALPQYNKAVEKSKAANAIILLKSVANAEEAFYLENGYYTKKLDGLTITIPWEQHKAWANNWHGGTSIISNNEWSLQTNVADAENTVVSADVVGIGRLSGAYKGSGFIHVLKNSVTAETLTPGLYCAERYDHGVTFELADNSYCQKIFNAKYTKDILSSRLYRME